jgi:hypothetical protein
LIYTPVFDLMGRRLQFAILSWFLLLSFSVDAGAQAGLTVSGRVVE